MTLSTRMSLALGLLAVLMLAAIVHILVIFSIPGSVTHTAFSDAAAFGPDSRFNVLPDILPGREPLPDLDPAMSHAVCRFHLDEGPVRFTATIPAPFWSMGLFDASGQTIYSLNNRTAGSDTLSLLLLSPSQLSILRQNPPEDLDDLIVIETEQTEGLALLRAYLSHPVQKSELRSALNSAQCAQMDPRNQTGN
ncbi:hypothetical protein GCM10011316_23600 [Roseibium aquae]|uniref:DUF1254 domain-containing protein n=1 Tax=Roseibium aquae TaxID=1323746 RepID=A0A916TL07_9HYPH|nr:DUF1254 domain-containing protein [Roseibium aquae]GGB50738.1 hypothetical protein GCM10011316_23600 [Roseibium aquae]